MLLAYEIYGYGFPLACDFLKELGYNQYGKSDVHINEIFSSLNLFPNKNVLDEVDLCLFIRDIYNYKTYF